MYRPFHIAVGDGNLVNLYKNGVKVVELAVHSTPVEQIIALRKHYLASRSKGEICIWDIPKSKCVAKITHRYVAGMVELYNGHLAAWFSNMKGFVVDDFSVEDKRTKPQSIPMEYIVTNIVPLRDKRLAVIMGGFICILDHNFERLNSFDFSNMIEQVAQDPSENRFFVSFGTRLEVWNLTTTYWNAVQGRFHQLQFVNGKIVCLNESTYNVKSVYEFYDGQFAQCSEHFIELFETMPVLDVQRWHPKLDIIVLKAYHNRSKTIKGQCICEWTSPSDLKEWADILYNTFSFFPRELWAIVVRY